MPKNTDDMSEIERVELEWKKLQIEELKEKLEARRNQIERLTALRDRQIEDFKKGQAEIARRQRVCLHRKGGRNNQFARGDSNNACVVRNTYPNGDVTIMCTRCFKEVKRPDRELRKRDPGLYKQQLEEWQKWDALPTDNSPSGGKIFEIVPAA